MTVYVTHEKDGVEKIVAEVSTVKEAEQFIARQEYTDPTGVHAGEYGVDAPEEAVT
jgi:hypothetical protein